MFEIKVIVDAPEIATALNNLAQAINNLTTKEPHTAAENTAADPTVAEALTEVAQIPTEVTVTKATPAVTNTQTVAQPVKQVTLDDLSRAGAELIDQGKMPQLIELLKKNGVQAITQLKPDQYAAVATELNALGAKL